MKLINNVKLILQGINGNEGFARSTVAAFCTPLSPTLEEINDIKTAVSEAVTNCIIHAYIGTIGEILIDVSLYDDNVVQIKISDDGCGFNNIEQARQPFYTTMPEKERSGMGFTLMEAFMDEIDIVSNVNEGTTITMRKKLNKAA